MPDEAAIGFWSYAHDDNELDHGAILELADLIKEEYNLLSGTPLQLFVDRDSIAWGDEWQERINSSLTQTTFFIAIITPRYFTRPECRRELLEFAAKAKGLGVEDLLLPLLYIEVQELSPDSPDEAVALVARTQYVDWHSNRLLGFGTSEYKTAVNVLARRLLEIARNVAEAQLDRELNSELDDDDTEGITDIVDKITALLPDWLGAVMGEKTNEVQVMATWDQYGKQLRKLQTAHAPASAILATRMRMAREFLPLCERGLKDASVYLTRSIELDPLISALVRMVAEHPDTLSLVAPIKEAVDEAMEEIRKDEKKSAQGMTTMTQRFTELAHLGRIFQKCFTLLKKRAQSSAEANQIVKRWNAELSSLEGVQS